ncbi:glycogen/starch synthase [Akkermansiaceae bacterium]|nr:glycogen/starch synthase [Akkermansiaceae bacterium]
MDIEHKPKPTILIVTPEITYLPKGMGNFSQKLGAKAGGLADVSATLVQHLHDLGADVHVALPNYREIFHTDVKNQFENTYKTLSKSLDKKRIHLAEDSIFYHRDNVYSAAENHRISLAFQREVINNIIPAVQPDLVHCNDWMTGIIPGAAKILGIKSLFTVHNIHSEKMLMAELQDRGIDVLEFWQNLYFEQPPHDLEWSRHHNPVNFLASGIFASNHVNTVSYKFLEEVVYGHHNFVPDAIKNELASKFHTGNASGIINAPDPLFDPTNDIHLHEHYDAKTHPAGKAANKKKLQQQLGLTVDENAPVFLWPSRLDPMQKGCQLLADILYKITSNYYDENLQVAVIAGGEFKPHFENIVNIHNLHHRVAVIDFNEAASHLGYAASDFIIMPSKFEPCGLPQMICQKYGSIPLVHDTGGLHDTVENLNYEKTQGNGFSFKDYNSEGLEWAVNEAMHFHKLKPAHKAKAISRIMTQANERFNHINTAKEYIKCYEQILDRPIT